MLQKMCKTEKNFEECTPASVIDNVCIIIRISLYICICMAYSHIITWPSVNERLSSSNNWTTESVRFMIYQFVIHNCAPDN